MGGLALLSILLLASQCPRFTDLRPLDILRAVRPCSYDVRLSFREGLETVGAN
jgi:hypothetical protein